MRKSFVFEEIKEYPEFEKFRKDSVYLYKIIRKKTDVKEDNWIGCWRQESMNRWI